MNKFFLVVGITSVVLFFPFSDLNAQLNIDTLKKINTINTAVPFLRIAPDARSGGMGDVGIGLSTDANSIFWNTAKLSFAEDQMGLAVTYTPWLRELVNDIYLASLGGFYKVDELQALSVGLRYFSLGSITFTNTSGEVIGDFNPQEFCIDAGYSRKLLENLSAGLNLGYVYSNLASGFFVNNIPIKAGSAARADISFFYNHEASFGKETDGSYNIGLTIANIGNKITYTENADVKDFLPTNMGLGGGVTFDFDEYNKLTLALDLNKLLVPTPDTSGDWRSKSVVQGIFGSFSDAPDGFGEEMREINISGGAEYWYKELFAIRAGYFYENLTKGNRKYLTAGLGIKYNIFGLNFSYLVPTSSQKNPLDNTLRFSLLFDFQNLDKEPQEVQEEE